MVLGDIFGVRFEGERNFGSTKVKNAPRSDLAHQILKIIVLGTGPIFLQLKNCTKLHQLEMVFTMSMKIVQ